MAVVSHTFCRPLPPVLIDEPIHIQAHARTYSRRLGTADGHGRQRCDAAAALEMLFLMMLRGSLAGRRTLLDSGAGGMHS